MTRHARHRIFDRIVQREDALRRRRPARDVDGAAVDRMTRRAFMTRAAAAGVALGTPPLLLAGCGSDTDDAPEAAVGTETRTLFFNIAHENPQAADTYYLIGGGRRHALVRTADRPAVLAAARQRNAFLRGVPTDQITHHVENAVFADDSTTLCHLFKPIDKAGGTWSMSSIYLHIPDSGVDHAYAKARARTPSGPLPRSAKREQYGHGGAMTAQDLREENALVDSASHAASLIMAHPDLMSGDPASAHNVYTNHAGTGSFTLRLARTLKRLGAALPEATSGQPNAAGWATLQPFLNEGPSQIAGPLRNRSGLNAGQIQYFPDWHPDVDGDAAAAMTLHIERVKNDASLGTVRTRTPAGAQPGSAPIGMLWARHDGFATVDATAPGEAVAGVSGDVTMTLVDQSPENGLDITASIARSGDTVKATVKVDNWYLRYLGLYLQFFDGSNPPKLLDLTKLKTYPDKILPDHSTSEDVPVNNPTMMFAGMVGPEFTLFAIPVDAGHATIDITVPSEASRIRILASGLALTGANPYPDTIPLGVFMTAAINYGLNVFFICAGASAKLSPFQRAVIVPVAALAAKEFASLFGSYVKSAEATTDPGTWKSFGIVLLKAIMSRTLTLVVSQIVTGIIAVVTESTFEDAVPVAGQIMRAVSCLVGAADLLHTTVDVAMSPFTYVKDLVFTHDLSVTLAPDVTKDSGFPAAATQYTVSALFDEGTPYVQTFAIDPPGPKTLPPVVFRGVPLGGMVDVLTSFVQPAKTSAADNVMLGVGKTGRVPNTSTDPIPTLTITELPFPIGPTTAYRHERKTVLVAGVNGGAPTHAWQRTSVAPTARTIDNGSLPGDLSALGSITVRQGTAQPLRQGYLGYSWRAFSSGIGDCRNGSVRNQLDQFANLNTDATNAQAGYAATNCGLPSGVRIGYNLLSHGTSNFYLDTSAGLIRQVQLEPTPRFDDYQSNRAWGKLNFTSNALLLHPSGKLVSISTVDHQMETLTIADALPDRQATTQLLARRHLGQGDQPGRLSSPVAAVVSAQGVVLVLEQDNRRIQALDIGANPVRYFTQQRAPYFLDLSAVATANTQFLDLAVEYTGFLYVLSVDAGSSNPVYRLDIFHPGQTGNAPISTTMNVNAGRLAVDFWRNVYTLNYEVMQVNGAFPSVTEPSVSLWTPCNVGTTC